jgi:hypothetical protein
MKFGIRTVLSLSSALVASGATGCGMIKNLDDMHDATNSMAATTQQMDQQMATTNQQITQTNQTSGQIAQTSTGMAGDVKNTARTALETYTALRQGNTSQARVGDNFLAGMNNAHAIEDKIFYAGAYVKAFEFQIWDSADPNSAQYLQTFYHQAAEEFTRILPNYLTTDQTKWSVSPTSTNNQKEDVYALAVTMQELNSNIVTAYKQGNWATQPQSLLDLIEDSIRTKLTNAAHPEQANLADHEFLTNEPLLEQLLQIRMNFLAAMAVDKIAGLDNKGFLGLKGDAREIGILAFKWEPNLKSLGSQDDYERMVEYTRYMYGANDMYAFLKSVGVTPKLDGIMHRIISNMKAGDAVQPEITSPKSDKDLAFNNTQEQIKKFLNQVSIYLNDGKGFVKIPEYDHPEFYKD